MKQYKVIYEPNTKSIENALNKLSKKGYDFVRSNVGSSGLIIIMSKEVDVDE